MATDYPIEITDPDGSVRIAGLADFIDPDNAPLPPGALPAVTVTLETAPGIQNNTRQLVPNNIVGGSSFAGQSSAIVALPNTPVAALGNIVQGGDIVLTTSGTVTSTPDPLDLSLSVYVSDASGTNVAAIQVSTQVASPVTDTAATLDLTGGTWTITAGVDLSNVTGGNLVTTAGGNFFITVYPTASWD